MAVLARGPRPLRLTGRLLVIPAIALAACSSAASSTLPVQTRPSPVAHLAGGAPSHVAVILMENHEYGQIIGSSQAPYINRLATQYALARRMYGITHPSLPNYLALTGGSTFGISSDCTSCSVHATSLVDQLENAHLSWKAYMEGLPHPCYTGGDQGRYAKRHDPFAYYTPVRSSSERCHKIVPLTQLAGDERANALPQFLWITPDLCHDMHDCGVGTGDHFLSQLVPPLLKALGPHGLLILTWDEGSTNNSCCHLASGGHIATILAGGLAKQGARLNTPTDHYSVLQTIEDLFGLARLRNAGCACTASLRPLLTG